jgi:hypothetical protein
MLEDHEIAILNEICDILATGFNDPAARKKMLLLRNRIKEIEKRKKGAKSRL